MMTELAQLQSELENSVKALRDLSPIFDLILELFPEQPNQVWQQQACWLLTEVQSCTDCQQDLLRGIAGKLNRLQTSPIREVSQ